MICCIQISLVRAAMECVSVGKSASNTSFYRLNCVMTKLLGTQILPAIIFEHSSTYVGHVLCHIHSIGNSDISKNHAKLLAGLLNIYI